MSSILKALKKIESQRPDDTNVYTGPHKAQLHKVLSKPRHSGRSVFRRITIPVAALTLVVFGWILLKPNFSWVTHRFSNNTPSSKSRLSNKIPAGSMTPDPEASPAAPKDKQTEKDSRGNTHTVSRKIAMTRVHRQQGTNVLEKETDNSKRQETSQNKNRTDDISTTPIQINDNREMANPVVESGAAAPNTEDINQKQQPKTTAVSGKTKAIGVPAIQNKRKPENKLPPEGKQAEEALPLKRINQSKMKLQAIVYSKSPEKRMAVINGEIVREGGYFENFSIIKIDKNDVFLNRNGVRYVMEFGGK